MQFFSKIPISFSENPIGYQSKIISIGSCFAENIGAKLTYYQFQQCTNPFGIIFNPISIEKIVRRTVTKDYFNENDVFFHQERWHSYDIHSELSHSDKDLFLKKLNSILDFFFKEIVAATHFTITLGTSWVYKTIVSDELVANCHKVQQKEFTKHLLSSIEIEVSLKNIVRLIAEINPKCQFVYTISPVRHIKDGFIQNQVSKANLIAAVYHLLEKDQNQVLSYFPSYEIMMDELRDYRFYRQDLLHPNTSAIDYIWSRFVETNVEESAVSTMKEVEIIQKGLQHRSFNPESVSHQKFLKNLQEKIECLQKRQPFMKFAK
jgi:hypothetical protein